MFYFTYSFFLPVIYIINCYNYLILVKPVFNTYGKYLLRSVKYNIDEKILLEYLYKLLNNSIEDRMQLICPSMVFTGVLFLQG